MELNKLAELTTQQVYKLFTKERINENTPIESDGRLFPIGARAYQWTNEALCTLESELNLDLEGRNMLQVAASGDPFGAFAYLNAGNQIGFDTSHRAVLWSELKVEAIKNLSYQEFNEFMGRTPVTHKKFNEYKKRIMPHLSTYARQVFTKLLAHCVDLDSVQKKRNFFRTNSEYFPRSNLYTHGEDNFNKAKRRLLETRQIFIPGNLGDILERIHGKFEGFYGSNILDHFRNGEDFDHSEATIQKFLTMIDSRLQGNPVIIMQYEWSENAKINSINVFKRIGYNVTLAKNESRRGYGNLLVARK
jgi:hypothetical protein